MRGPTIAGLRAAARMSNPAEIAAALDDASASEFFVPTLADSAPGEHQLLQYEHTAQAEPPQLSDCWSSDSDTGGAPPRYTSAFLPSHLKAQDFEVYADCTSYGSMEKLLALLQEELRLLSAWFLLLPSLPRRLRHTAMSLAPTAASSGKQTAQRQKSQDSRPARQLACDSSWQPQLYRRPSCPAPLALAAPQTGDQL